MVNSTTSGRQVRHRVAASAPVLQETTSKSFPVRYELTASRNCDLILNYQYPVPWHPLALLKSRDLPPRKGEIFSKHTLKMGVFVKMHVLVLISEQTDTVITV